MPPLQNSKCKKKGTSNETLESNWNALIKDMQSRRLANYFIAIRRSH